MRDQLERLYQKLDGLNVQLSQSSTASRERDERILAEVLENRQTIAVHSHRIEAVERKLQAGTERNGATQLEELKRLRDSKAHWVRYVIGTLVGVVVSAIFLTITLVAR